MEANFVICFCNEVQNSNFRDSIRILYPHIPHSANQGQSVHLGDTFCQVQHWLVRFPQREWMVVLQRAASVRFESVANGPPLLTAIRVSRGGQTRNRLLQVRAPVFRHAQLHLEQIGLK